MAARSFRVKVGERWYTVAVDLSASPAKVTVDGQTYYVEFDRLRGSRAAPRKATTPRAPRTQPPQVRPPATGISERVIRSPMPGKVIAVNVRPGDTVLPGQEVCVIEAMKMEQSIRTPQGGLIKAVHTQPLQQVGTDDPLVELE